MTTMMEPFDISKFNESLARVRANKSQISKSFMKTLKGPNAEQIAKTRPTFDVPGIEDKTVAEVAKLCGIDMEAIKKDAGSGALTSDLYTLMPILTERFGFALQTVAELNEALSLFPIATVSYDRAKWYTFDKYDPSRVDYGYMDEGDGTTSIRVKQSTDEYSTRKRGKHFLMTEELIARTRNEGGFGTVGIDEIANLVLAQWVTLTRIKQYVELLFDDDSFDDLNSTDFPSQQPQTSWRTTGNYILDIKAAAREIRLASVGTVSRSDLTLAIRPESLEKMQFNETIMDYVSAGGSTGSPAIPGADEIAAFCGIKRVVEVDAVQVVTAETEDNSGQSASFMLDADEAVLYYDNPNPTGAVADSAVTNFAATDLPGLNGQGIRTYPFFPKNEQVLANAIAVNVKDGPTITGAHLGRKFKGITR